MIYIRDSLKYKPQSTERRNDCMWLQKSKQTWTLKIIWLKQKSVTCILQKLTLTGPVLKRWMVIVRLEIKMATEMKKKTCRIASDGLIDTHCHSWKDWKIENGKYSCFKKLTYLFSCLCNKLSWAKSKHFLKQITPMLLIRFILIEFLSK